jgi:regulator of sirC expression with transglutaminase-like and TPR domain
MINPADPRAALSAAGRLPDGALDIAGLALAFASLERPGTDLAAYRDHLAALARAVTLAAAALPTGPQSAAAALKSVLVDAEGYRGDTDTYDDLQNADLTRVIDRRRGLPVALSILWLHAGRAQGWSMCGLAFPGHFLIRLDAADGRVILDPFHDGRALGPDDLRTLLKQLSGPEAELAPDHYAPVGDRAILLRLQNNIKLRLIRDSAFDRALPVLERMTLLAPDDPGLWHETAMVHERLGALRAAVSCFETAHLLAQSDAARHRIAADLQAVRSRLN